jgi:hypothetical protein
VRACLCDGCVSHTVCAILLQEAACDLWKADETEFCEPQLDWEKKLCAQQLAEALLGVR